jgi:hypothetical protein
MTAGMGTRYRSTTLVSFAPRQFRQQQIYLVKSAIKVGIDYVACWNEHRLSKEPFFANHTNIFCHAIGFGCWLWKPYIINYELTRMSDGAFLI